MQKPHPMPIAEFERRFRETFLRDMTEEERRFFRLASLVIEDAEETPEIKNPAA
jgi:hypothetical protein